MENNSTVAPARTPLEEQHIISALSRINKRLRKGLEGEHKRLRREYYEAHKDPKGFVQCPVTGKRIRFEQLSVDHIIPFWQLRNQWLRLRNIPIRKDRKITTEELQDWQRWHHQHAQLRIMDKQANKELGAQWYCQSYTWVA